MNRSRPPLSTIAVDLGCLAFAAWTVLCNIVVALGMNPIALAIVTGLALVAGATALAGARSRAALASLLDEFGADRGVDKEVVQPTGPRSLVVRIVGVCTGVLALERYARAGDRLELCVFVVASFSIAYLVLSAEEPSSGERPPHALEEAGLWALAIGFAVLTLIAHRANNDDSFYVNMAVSVRDFPHEPLLRRDTLHNLGPMKIPAYRATSLEVLAGLLSLVTRLPGIAFAHMVLPPLFAFATPLGLARLARKLDPERCVYAVAIAMLFLVFDGRGRGSYGTFAMTRLYQGKAVLCILGLPLCMAYGVLFAERPSRARFALLASAQIASLGLSVTAFWAAPIAAMFGVAAGLPLRIRSLRTLALGALSSGYLVAFGLYLKLQESGMLAAVTSAAAASGDDAPEEGEQAGPDLLAHAFAMVLGKPKLVLPALGVILLTWPLCRTVRARRFALVVPLAFFAVLGNPKLTRIVAAITTGEIHWRVLWLVPLPLLVGLLFSSILSPSQPRAQLYRAPLCAAALFAFLSLGPRSTLARSRFDWPHPKVDMHAYRVALALIDSMPPHRPVLAPVQVSRVLPMLNGYGYPLFVKPPYIIGGPGERASRRRLTSLVGRPRGRGAAQRLLEGIERYRIQGVVLPMQEDDKRSPARALSAAGFRLAREIEQNQIWTRIDPR